MIDSDKFVVNKDGVLLQYKGTESEVVIPTGVQRIDNDVFEDNLDVVSVIIPEGVTSIGVGAFNRCSNIKSIKLPDSLTRIEMGAFGFCKSLEEIVIPENVKKIGCSAFHECLSLQTVNYLSRKCSDITSDGNYQFYTYCDYGNYFDDITPVFSICPSLKTINIGENVKYIPSELFREIYEIDELNIFASGKLSIGFKAFEKSIDLEKYFSSKLDLEVEYMSHKNYRFPQMNILVGTLVKHEKYGLGEVKAVYEDKNMIEIRFFFNGYGTRCFLFPHVFWLDKVKCCSD